MTAIPLYVPVQTLPVATLTGSEIVEVFVGNDVNAPHQTTTGAIAALAVSPSISGTATTLEAIAAGAVCNVTSSGIQNANATNLTKPANCFVKAAYASPGLAATFYVAGQVITGLTGLTQNATYWLDVVAGGITTTPPSTSGNANQIVGIALSTSSLFFNPGGVVGA